MKREGVENRDVKRKPEVQLTNLAGRWDVENITDYANISNWMAKWIVVPWLERSGGAYSKVMLTSIIAPCIFELSGKRCSEIMETPVWRSEHAHLRALCPGWEQIPWGQRPSAWHKALLCWNWHRESWVSLFYQKR